jgi:uncharacterized membrane protein YdjX (TVP38/TMEM64 family)
MKRIIKPIIALVVLLLILLSCVWAGFWFHYSDVAEWIKSAGTASCAIVGFFTVIAVVVVASAPSDYHSF